MRKSIAIGWIALLLCALSYLIVLRWHWLTKHDDAVLEVAVALLLIGAIFPFSAWLVSSREVKEQKERLSLQNDVRTTIFQAIAGLAVFVGAFVAWQQLQSVRSESQATNTLASQEQVAQAYTQAVSELGSSQEDIRIGGMYALEEIFKAGQNPYKEPTNPVIIRIRPAVFGLLTAYIRTHDAWAGSVPHCDRAPSEALSERAADIQEALNVLGGRGYGAPNEPNLFLEHVNLDGAVLYGSFDDTDFDYSELANTDFVQTSLGGADFVDTDLCGADLAGVSNFEHDDFEGSVADSATRFPRGFNPQTYGIVIMR